MDVVAEETKLAKASTPPQLRLRFIRSVGEGFIVPTFLNMETAAQALVDLVEDFLHRPGYY